MGFLRFMRNRFVPPVVERGKAIYRNGRFMHPETLCNWTLDTFSDTKGSITYVADKSVDPYAPFSSFNGTLMSCVEASGKDLTKGTSPSGDKVYSRCTLQSKVIVLRDYLIFKDYMDASEYDGIAIRGRGDGNVFWVQIYSMDVLKSEFSHFYGLKTITDAWKTYYIPFKLFERPNDMHTYLNVLPHTSRISRMSVSITSTGPDDVPFSLDLKEIYFCKREEALRRRRNLLK